MSGNPLNRVDLRSVHINTCAASVILSAKRAHGSHDSTMSDKEAILCSLNIKAMVNICAGIWCNGNFVRMKNGWAWNPVCRLQLELVLVCNGQNVSSYAFLYKPGMSVINEWSIGSKCRKLGFSTFTHEKLAQKCKTAILLHSLLFWNQVIQPAEKEKGKNDQIVSRK